MRYRLLMHTILEFRMRDRVCYECADLHPVPLKSKCHMFCSRKAVRSRIYKFAVRYDRQKISIFSVKITLNPRSLFSFFFFFPPINGLLMRSVGAKKKKKKKKKKTKINDNVKTVPYCHLCEAIKLV